MIEQEQRWPRYKPKILRNMGKAVAAGEISRAYVEARVGPVQWQTVLSAAETKDERNARRRAEEAEKKRHIRLARIEDALGALLGGRSGSELLICQLGKEDAELVLQRARALGFRFPPDPPSKACPSCGTTKQQRAGRFCRLCWARRTQPPNEPARAPRPIRYIAGEMGRTNKNGHYSTPKFGGDDLGGIWDNAVRALEDSRLDVADPGGKS